MNSANQLLSSQILMIENNNKVAVEVKGLEQATTNDLAIQPEGDGSSIVF